MVVSTLQYYIEREIGILLNPGIVIAAMIHLGKSYHLIQNLKAHVMIPIKYRKEDYAILKVGDFEFYANRHPTNPRIP